MMMTKLECAQWLRRHDRFLILTHQRPDGDTLGSAAALCLGLREMGKTAYVLENTETPENLSQVCRGLTTDQVDADAVLVSVDVASAEMLMKNAQPYLERIALRIDHHKSATSFTELELVIPEMGACAEVIYDILTEMGVALTEQIAIALYIGVSTDTGCFRYANVTAHTFLTAAACAATGANLQPINQALFDTVSLNQLRVQAWVTAHTKFYCSGKVAVCPIPFAMLGELGVSKDDLEGMSGFVRSIAGVCIGATLREADDGKIYLSLRSVPGYNSAAVCEKFGGGGHAGAAGGNSRLPLAEIEQQLTAAMIAEAEK